MRQGCNGFAIEMMMSSKQQRPDCERIPSFAMSSSLKVIPRRTTSIVVVKTDLEDGANKPRTDLQYVLPSSCKLARSGNLQLHYNGKQRVFRELLEAAKVPFASSTHPVACLFLLSMPGVQYNPNANRYAGID